MNETQYRQLFLDDLHANQEQFLKERERVIKEYGDSEEIRLDFYKGAFKSIITSHKKELPKDDLYSSHIIRFYNIFISALKRDNIDVTELEKELRDFKEIELPNIKITPRATMYTPVYKQYNPNTKYGRKKALEQARRNYANGTPEYQNDIDNIKIVLWIIVIIVAIIFYIMKIKLSAN